jgi:hypothetical protein
MRREPTASASQYNAFCKIKRGGDGQDLLEGLWSIGQARRVNPAESPAAKTHEHERRRTSTDETRLALVEDVRR